jgi:hypothetical protein
MTSSPEENPPIVTTSNTLPKAEPPTSDPAQDAHTISPPPTTGQGKGLPLDISAALGSAGSTIASVLPASVSTALGVGEPTPAAPAPDTPTTPRRPDEPEDPKISALRAMFPDFDVSILCVHLTSLHVCVRGALTAEGAQADGAGQRARRAGPGGRRPPGHERPQLRLDRHRARRPPTYLKC